MATNIDYKYITNRLQIKNRKKKKIMLAGTYTETILCLPKTELKTSKYKELFDRYSFRLLTLKINFRTALVTPWFMACRPISA